MGDVASNHVMVNSAVVREQYGDDAHLRARQALWRLRTGPSLYETVLDLACIGGSETIVDVGCGNGAYLAELRRRDHSGQILGLDLSEALARHAGRHARTAVADAQALPLSDSSVDVALSLHMLYHVPDIELAIAELRRVVRPGGVTMVATNGPGHTAEIKAVLSRAAAQVAGIEVDREWDTRRFTPSQARRHLAGAFDAVAPHSLGDSFPADPAVVVGYLASWPPESVGLEAGGTWDAIVARAGELVTSQGTFTVTSELSVFACR